MASPSIATIGPVHKLAIMEAFGAAVAIIPPHQRDGLVLVGGASLLFLEGIRYTSDVDIAVTGPALHAFFNAAALDPRFRQGSDGAWEYTSFTIITVPFEFLAQGGAPPHDFPHSFRRLGADLGRRRDRRTCPSASHESDDVGRET